MIPVSLVTPSTSWAISSPNSLLDLLEAGAGVLDGVVQQRGAERLGVEPQPGADLRDLDRVGDELVARAAPLVGVALAGELEGALDGARSSGRRLRGVLGDDREQVAEERPVLGRERARRTRRPRADDGRVLAVPTRV